MGCQDGGRRELDQHAANGVAGAISGCDDDAADAHQHEHRERRHAGICAPAPGSKRDSAGSDRHVDAGYWRALATNHQPARFDSRLRVNQETQQQGQLTSFLGLAQQIQALFNETAGTGLQSSLTGFFNSLSRVSANPSDLNARQGVLTAAQNLARTFNQTSANLTTLQRNVDLSVSQSVSQINLTAQIATVNAQVSAAQSSGQNAGPFVDQRQQLINQLSNLVDVSEIDAGNGSLTLTTNSGAPLVVAGQSFQLTMQTDAVTGLQHIFSQGSDITSRIAAGQLAGQLQIRDQEIPSVQSSLDTLAASLANSVNTQHQAGFDLNGAAGGNLFVPPPAAGLGAASTLAVAITDPTKIAASKDEPQATTPTSMRCSLCKTKLSWAARLR
jgi:flagellar hook-associated protein 1